ncbi:hypothetical protein D3C85_1071950 [compost metagenome]
MQTINTKVRKLYRTYSGISTSFNIKCSSFIFLVIYFSGNIYEYATSSRPQFMQIRPFMLRSIKTNTRRCKPVSRTHDFKITDVYNYLTAKMIISRWNIDNRTRLSAFIHIRVRLPTFNICYNAIDYLSNILIRITDRPLCYVVIIFTSHK